MKQINQLVAKCIYVFKYKKNPQTTRPRTSSYGIYPNLEYLLSVCLITGKGSWLFCWVSRVSILIFLWHSWNFYQEENSAMAYSRKCSVYLKCLYEHTKANNYCHKVREQLLVVWCLIWPSLCSSLAHLSLPFLCSAPHPSLHLLNPSAG